MEMMLETVEISLDNGFDLSLLCRICASPNEYLLPIFQGEGVDHNLESKINNHLPIIVTECDKLPVHVCYQCASTLIAWHDMVDSCIESDKKFRNYSLEEKKQTVNIKEEEGENLNKSHGSKKQINEHVSKPIDQASMQTASADTKEVIIVKEGNVPNTLSLSSNENMITAVEVYEDVETSVVVHDFVENFQSGHYIAYIDNEYIESSIEIGNNESAILDFNEDSKPLICDECGQIFTNLTLFKHHLNTHHNRHYCQHCDANYKNIDHLHKHIEIMHPNSNNALVPKEKRINPYAKTFLCNACGKILKSSIAYENHTLKHQSKCPYSCSICSETFPNRGARRKHEVKVHNLLTKENGNLDGYHVCEICGLEMFSDGAYYHHKDKHGDPYPCGFCGKLYGSRSLMQVHARRHTNERPFVCSLCNRNFKVKQELNAHMNIHKDLRPYQCPHCPKTCRKSSDLTHHIRTHTGEKPYICDKCGRGFAQAGDMRKHRQLHFRPSKLNKNISLESKV